MEKIGFHLLSTGFDCIYFGNIDLQCNHNFVCLFCVLHGTYLELNRLVQSERQPEEDVKCVPSVYVGGYFPDPAYIMASILHEPLQR